MVAYIVLALTVLIIIFNLEVGPTKIITTIFAVIFIAGGIFGGKKFSEYED